MSKSELEIRYSDSAGQQHAVELHGTIRVGRTPDVDLILDQDGVSRLHCQFVASQSGVVLQDLESTNGTYLNGTRVQEASLQDGDTVVIGRVLLQVATVGDTAGTADKTLYLGPESVELAIDSGTQYLPEKLAPETGRRHLQAMYGILNTVGSSRDMEEMLRSALKTIRQTLDFDFGHILLGTAADHLKPVATVSRDKQAPPPASRTVIQRVLRQSQAILANDIQAEPELAASKSIAAAGALRIACAPVPLAERLGVIYLAARGLGRQVEADDISFLNAAARQLGLAAQVLAERTNLARENELLRGSVPTSELIGQSAVMQKLRDRVIRAGQAGDATVLITGASGTGKELVARGVHQASTRSSRDLVALNCGALPASVVQSELFGHEKGAFTGAEQRRIGLVELAHGSTLFLDEVAELSPEVQVMLLRLIEEKCFFRVGGQQEIQVDVRFIAATNRDLDQLCRDGRFRADLLYRLKVVEIKTPSLKEHHEDVKGIAAHLMDELARANRRSPKPLSKDAETALIQHGWPGNIRELRNVLERALLLSDSDTIQPVDLGIDREATTTATRAPLISLSEVEKEHILRVLEATGWNKTRAAEVLGVARITLYEKIKSYQLKPRP